MNNSTHPQLVTPEVAAERAAAMADLQNPDGGELDAVLAAPCQNVSMAGRRSAPVARIRALDLFAGTGWGVACKWLGIAERGVEIMEEAVQTRTANGMETIYRDVWDGLQLTEEEHRRRYGSYGLLIASPPCQTFSLAGNGAGRAAMDEVLEAIAVHAYKDADALREFGDKHDPRTALVLSPLAYVWRDRPRLVAMEQVPTVLPVWEACAEVMREWGYDVKVEVLNAEQYGVPQTRRRAILVARRGGDVHLPVPTHSRYYSRTPDRLDPDVKKWVSMAEALGWGMTDQPMPTITAGVHGPTDRWASGGNSVRKMIDGKIGGPNWVEPAEPLVGDGNVRTQYPVRIGVEEASLLQTYPSGVTAVRTSMGTPKVDGRNGTHELDPVNRPAHTVTTKADSWTIETDGSSRKLTAEEASLLQTYPSTRRGLAGRPAPTITGGGTETGGAEPIAKFHERYTSAPDWEGSTERLSVEEAAALQTFPSSATKNMGRGMVERHGERPGRPVEAPAFTVRASAGGTEPGGFVWTNEDGTTRKTTPEEVAALQSYPAALRPEVAAWKWVDAPATTIQGDPRITAGEASTLQTYARPFVWCGTKSKKFLQIGNAVPPVLAEAVLAALVGFRPGR